MVQFVKFLVPGLDSELG